MYFTAADLAQSLLSLVLYIPLLLLPGVAIGALARPDDSLPISPGERLAEGLVLAFTVLPLLDSMAVRFAGLSAALVVNVVLAAIGLAVLVRSGTVPVLRTLIV